MAILTMTMRSVKDLYFWIFFTAFISLIQQLREPIRCPMATGVASSLETYRDVVVRGGELIKSEEHKSHDSIQQQQPQGRNVRAPPPLPLPKPQTPVKDHLTRSKPQNSQLPRGGVLSPDSHGDQLHEKRTNSLVKKKKTSSSTTTKQIPPTNNAPRKNDSSMIHTDPPQLEKWFRERLPPNPPRPVQIVKEYIQQHSIWSHGFVAQEGQKYMVISYQCPHRAGNVIGTLLNQMLMAVLTNRTAVFYVRGTRGEKVCDSILQRAKWMPRLEYASKPFGSLLKFYQQTEIYKGAKNQLGVPRFPIGAFRKSIARQLIARNRTGAALAEDLSDYNVIEIRGLSGCLHSSVEGWEGRFDWTVPSCRDYITALFQKESIDVNRANQLFELGIDFVYGMLFRLTFDLTPGLLNSITYSGDIDPNAFSIGIHSRHALESNDGSDISREQLCLDLVMKRRPSTSGCQLLVMSDRPATYLALQKYAAAHNCEVVHVQHSANIHAGQYLADTSGYTDKGEVSAEHGPFEGAGFYKDLALVSQARHGLVCTMRSSSALIKQAMEYDNFMRYYQAHSEDDPSMEKYHSPETCFYEGNMISKATIGDITTTAE